MRRRVSLVAREAERSELERLKRGRDTWHPQHALAYCWARIDSTHGRGGSHYIGRPSRPDDPGYGDGWRLTAFLAALEQDRAEIDERDCRVPRTSATAAAMGRSDRTARATPGSRSGQP